MAVSAPVLERKINTENEILERKLSTKINFAPEVSRISSVTSDEDHNARIKSNYEKLINPDSTVSDIINTGVQQKHEEPVVEQKLFWVENARADSDLFRVDSIMNSRQAETEPETEQEEEENEDLRPSEETFKYKTKAVDKVEVADKVSHKQVKSSKFTKRDKIIMAVALVVIVALFVLVIVNSAVLSNLNSEVSVLQGNLAVARENYEGILADKESFFSNIEETIANFAAKNGMSRI